MSHILQIFHGPHIRTVAEAVSYIDAHLNERGNDRAVARFRDFVRLMDLVYPDLSDEDEDGELDPNLWPEGLVYPEDGASAWNLAIKSDAAQPSVLCAVAVLALKAELQVLDPQMGVLFRSDRTVVDARGQSFGFPDRSPSSEARMRPRCVTVKQVRERIAERMATCLPGFDVAVNANAAAIRRLGMAGVSHTVLIEADTGLVGVKVMPELMLAHSLIARTWLGLLPELADWKSTSDSLHAGQTYDFVYGVADLVDELPGPAPSLDSEHLLTLDEADQYADRLAAFIGTHLLPLLDQVQGLADLARVTLTPDAVDVARTGVVRLPEQLALLTLTALQRPEQYDEVVTALRSNPAISGVWAPIGGVSQFEKLVAGMRDRLP